MLSPVTSAYFTPGLRAEGAGSPPTDLVGPKATPGRQSARGSGWAALPPEPSLNLLARDAEHCQPSWGSREQEGPADARAGLQGRRPGAPHQRIDPVLLHVGRLVDEAPLVLDPRAQV